MLRTAIVTLISAVFFLSLTGNVTAQHPGLHWSTEEVASGIASPVDTYLLFDSDTIWHVEEDYREADQVYTSLYELFLDHGIIQLMVDARPPYISEEEAFSNIQTWLDVWLLDAALTMLTLNEIDFTFHKTELEDLTDQIWAVQVEAEPGQTGHLSQDFEAAYGPFRDDDSYIGSGDDAWWFVDEDGERTTDPGEVAGTDAGEYYVGNYFTIDQLAATSGGIVKRYINISSPWTGAYLEEDMSVEGVAEIRDSFNMVNLDPGSDIIPEFWELF